MLRTACIVLLLLANSACFYRTRVITGAKAEPQEHSDTGVSIWGLNQVTTDARECKHGVAEVRSYWPWYVILTAAFTAFLIVPIRTEYACVTEPSPQQSPSPPEAAPLLP